METEDQRRMRLGLPAKDGWETYVRYGPEMGNFNPLDEDGLYWTEAVDVHPHLDKLLRLCKLMEDNLLVQHKTYLLGLTSTINDCKRNRHLEIPIHHLKTYNKLWKKYKQLHNRK